MKLNRSNSLIRQEPETRTPNGGLIRRAIVWGSTEAKVTEDELIRLWKSKPRKTPLAVMLTKAQTESSYRPYISRFEVGHLEGNAKWKWKTEFDSTSYGLFQFMGFYLRGRYAVADQANVYATYTVARQMDHFDEFFSDLLLRAKSKFKGESEDKSIWRAFAAYSGNYDPKPNSSVFYIANKNLAAYLKKKSQYETAPPATPVRDGSAPESA